MSMAFELPARVSDATTEGRNLRQVAATIVSLDEGSSGAGLARAVLLGFGFWILLFGVFWSLLR
jgi:hypothetical protein